MFWFLECSPPCLLFFVPSVLPYNKWICRDIIMFWLNEFLVESESVEHYFLGGDSNVDSVASFSWRLVSVHCWIVKGECWYAKVECIMVESVTILLSLGIALLWCRSINNIITLFRLYVTLLVYFPCAWRSTHWKFYIYG
jgi:hypothetical protein